MKNSKHLYVQIVRYKSNLEIMTTFASSIPKYILDKNPVSNTNTYYRICMSILAILSYSDPDTYPKFLELMSFPLPDSHSFITLLFELFSLFVSFSLDPLLPFSSSLALVPPLSSHGSVPSASLVHVLFSNPAWNSS